jgi:hypothetical protein
MEELIIFCMEMTTLDHISSTIQILMCDYNTIFILNNLPPQLMVLNCSHNYITKIENLLNSLIEFYHSHNPINKFKIKQKIKCKPFTLFTLKSIVSCYILSTNI